MPRKDKLLEKLRRKIPSFKWDEACSLMKAYGFDLRVGEGSRRRFVHRELKFIVLLHEPHPQNTLKPYTQSALLEALERIEGMQQSGGCHEQ